jgi:hypothetical protein
MENGKWKMGGKARKALRHEGEGAADFLRCQKNVTHVTE